MYLEPSFDPSEASGPEGEAAVAKLLAQFVRAARNAFSGNTERALKSDLGIWAEWCVARGVMLPSTCLTVSALRTISFSALNIPARMHRYRRFTPSLTADDARLAEKRGWLLLSFRGTFTRYPSTSLPGTLSIRRRPQGYSV